MTEGSFAKGRPKREVSPQSMWRSRAGFWAGVGAGVATFATLMALSKENGLKSSCPGSVCDDTKYNHDQYDSLKVLRVAAFAAGGLALVGLSVGVWSISGSSPERKTAMNAASISPEIGLSWLGLRGRF